MHLLIIIFSVAIIAWGQLVGLADGQENSLKDQILQRPTFGNPGVRLGVLFDYRTMQYLPESLWPESTIKDMKHIIKMPHTHYSWHELGGLETKLNLLQVKAEISLDVMDGQVHVAGSAEYFTKKKKSNNHVAITFKDSRTDRYEELTMEALNTPPNLSNDDGIKERATHFVTAIMYGADAYFTFESEANDEESKQTIYGKLELQVNKFKAFQIEASASVSLNTSTVTTVAQFACHFHGDYSISTIPQTYKEALDMHIEIRKSKNFVPVPMRVWLYPISLVGLDISQMLADIKQSFTNQIFAKFQKIERLEVTLETLKDMKTIQNLRLIDIFTTFRQKLQKFGELLEQFKADFQLKLRRVLPRMRGGDSSAATELGKILGDINKSWFKTGNLHGWLETKTAQMTVLRKFLSAFNKSTELVTAERRTEIETNFHIRTRVGLRIEVESAIEEDNFLRELGNEIDDWEDAERERQTVEDQKTAASIAAQKQAAMKSAALAKSGLSGGDIAALGADDISDLTAADSISSGNSGQTHGESDYGLMGGDALQGEAEGQADERIELGAQQDLTPNEQVGYEQRREEQETPGQQEAKQQGGQLRKGQDVEGGKKQEDHDDDQKQEIPSGKGSEEAGDAELTKSIGPSSNLDLKVALSDLEDKASLQAGGLNDTQSHHSRQKAGGLSSKGKVEEEQGTKHVKGEGDSNHTASASKQNGKEINPVKSNRTSWANKTKAALIAVGNTVLNAFGGGKNKSSLKPAETIQTNNNITAKKGSTRVPTVSDPKANRTKKQNLQKKDPAQNPKAAKSERSKNGSSASIHPTSQTSPLPSGKDASKSAKSKAQQPLIQTENVPSKPDEEVASAKSKRAADEEELEETDTGLGDDVEKSQIDEQESDAASESQHSLADAKEQITDDELGSKVASGSQNTLVDLSEDTDDVASRIPSPVPLRNSPKNTNSSRYQPDKQDLWYVNSRLQGKLRNLGEQFRHFQLANKPENGSKNQESDQFSFYVFTEILKSRSANFDCRIQMYHGVKFIGDAAQFLLEAPTNVRITDDFWIPEPGEYSIRADKPVTITWDPPAQTLNWDTSQISEPPLTYLLFLSDATEPDPDDPLRQQNSTANNSTAIAPITVFGKREHKLTFPRKDFIYAVKVQAVSDHGKSPKSLTYYVEYPKPEYCISLNSTTEYYKILSIGPTHALTVNGSDLVLRDPQNLTAELSRFDGKAVLKSEGDSNEIKDAIDKNDNSAYLLYENDDRIHKLSYDEGEANDPSPGYCSANPLFPAKLSFVRTSGKNSNDTSTGLVCQRYGTTPVDEVPAKIIQVDFDSSKVILNTTLGTKITDGSTNAIGSFLHRAAMNTGKAAGTLDVMYMPLDPKNNTEGPNLWMQILKENDLKNGTTVLRADQLHPKSSEGNAAGVMEEMSDLRRFLGQDKNGKPKQTKSDDEDYEDDDESDRLIGVRSSIAIDVNDNILLLRSVYVSHGDITKHNCSIYPELLLFGPEYGFKKNITTVLPENATYHYQCDTITQITSDISDVFTFFVSNNGVLFLTKKEEAVYLIAYFQYIRQDVELPPKVDEIYGNDNETDATIQDEISDESGEDDDSDEDVLPDEKGTSDEQKSSIESSGNSTSNTEKSSGGTNENADAATDSDESNETSSKVVETDDSIDDDNGSDDEHQSNATAYSGQSAKATDGTYETETPEDTANEEKLSTIHVEEESTDGQQLNVTLALPISGSADATPSQTEYLADIAKNGEKSTVESVDAETTSVGALANNTQDEDKTTVYTIPNEPASTLAESEGTTASITEEATPSAQSSEDGELKQNSSPNNTETATTSETVVPTSVSTPEKSESGTGTGNGTVDATTSAGVANQDSRVTEQQK